MSQVIQDTYIQKPQVRLENPIETCADLLRLPQGSLECHTLEAVLRRYHPGNQHIVFEFQMSHLDKAAGFLNTEARLSENPELKVLLQGLALHVRGVEEKEAVVSEAE